ncbi:MAG: hypothetical protein A2V98_08790 [Planctomycetes bacterium RBG_16_64_12]|nr:MAG: hypothetical protein A2V98_08790 [Planctomycetes bacterium RBG_16_64_12]
MTGRATLTPQEKQRLVSAVPCWWHSIDLGDGVVTPGSIQPDIHRILCSAIPADLTGQTVLDVGAWDGYYSFECEKRGAKVTAIDNNSHQRGHEGFHTARRILNSRVAFLEMDLFDLPKTIGGQFDVVLLFGVLYHLKHPLRGLEILSSKTRKLLIVESYYVRTLTNDPMMRFFPGAELEGDPSNWWGPNIPCALDMLRVAGFRRVRVHTAYANRLKDGRVIVKAHK